MSEHGAQGPGRLAPREASRLTGRVTSLSVATALVLIAAKIAAVVLSGSVAVLASLADSSLDLAAALITFFAVRYAATPADAEHRYGHGKAESFAAIMQAGLVLAAAVLVAREAVMRFVSAEPVTHGGVALGVMAFATALTLLLVRAQTRAFNETGSVAVAGDRAHYVSDIAANGSVMAGVALSSFGGLAWADPLVGFGVALWLVWTAWGVARGGLDQMMDRELPDGERAHIAELAESVDGVREVHGLRTRAAGPLVHIQMHAEMDPAISLEAAHRILVAAEEAILTAYPGADVLIHPDPQGRAAPHGNPHLRSPDGEEDPAEG